VQAQNISVNLVPNGRFELSQGCPSNFGAIGQCDSWNALHGSPDYFHSCGQADVAVPANYLGNQSAYPITDSAYVGVVTYTTLFSGGQESIVATLTEPLVAGEKYRVKLKASSAEHVNYVTCCVGVILGETSPPFPPYMMNISDVELVLNSTNVDTGIWYQMDEVYTAQGGEDKMFIGNFRPDSESDWFYRGEIVPGSATAYYYIDDVEVYLDEPVGIDDDELLKSEVSVYPNPAVQTVHIQSPMPLKQVELFDLRGCLVQTVNTGRSNNWRIDVSALHTGIYLLHATTTDGQMAVLKLMKNP
jgi:hypothetical protein